MTKAGAVRDRRPRPVPSFGVRARGCAASRRCGPRTFDADKASVAE